jgi:tetratricopeptide (TPR) repeat protein
VEEVARPTVRGDWGVRRTVVLVFDVVLALGLVAVLAFPVAARVSARAIALPPPAPTRSLPPLRRAPAGTLQHVPEFTAGGHVAGAVREGDLLTDVTSMYGALNDASRALFGTTDYSPMAHLVLNGNLRLSDWLIEHGVDYSHIRYPFRYPPLDRFLDRALPAKLSETRSSEANDLAGLLILAAARYPSQLPNAAPAAFDLLNRARAGDACQPQTNLAFLLSTDENSRDDDTRTEFLRATADCPGDPTPLDLLAEYQSVRTLGKGNDMPSGAGVRRVPTHGERIHRALDTARRLQREFPGSPAGWAAEADTDVRLGYLTQTPQPFTARNWFRRAIPLYRRAMALSADPGLPAGAARAEAGLHEEAQAAALQARAVRGDPTAMPLQVRLIDYLERAHRFAVAAAENGGFLAGTSRLPDGRALIAAPPVGVGGETEDAFEEDATGPISLDATALKSVTLAVGPEPGGAGGGALDISFIPTFRPIHGVTGQDRWCREWSRRRDLILAGRSAEALRDFPTQFADARTGDPCGATDELAGIAELELGDPDAALDRARGAFGRYPEERLLTMLSDARQDLWRYAGDLDRARAAAEAWHHADPADPLALDRIGEIAYLGGDYGHAADEFTAAYRAAGSNLQRADELVKWGTALEMDHRTADALRVLPQVEPLAEPIRARVSKRFGIYDQTGGQAAYDEYNAQVQAGDTELRVHHYAQAVPHYDAARRLEKDIPGVPGERLIRPEVLESNEALDLVEVGRPSQALSLAEAAVRIDPADPIFLENQGFAQVQLGRLGEAARSYRAALASDPTLFPAANDLGVILAKEGRLDGAELWLRRAVGAEPDYPIARFNLGIVLARRGPAHLLASQGAFADAARLDSSFRFRNRSLVFDDDAYFTTLDLSKPLPPHWRFVRSERRAPVAVAAVVLLLVLIRFGRAIASEVGGGKAQERVLEMSRRRALLRRALDWRVGPWLAIVATLAVFLWPLAVAGGATTADYLALGVGIAVLIGVAVRTRALAGRGLETPPRQMTWTPTVAMGLAAAAVGFGFAPMPVAHHDDHPGRLHSLPPLVMGTIAVALLLIAHLTQVPVTRALGAAALVMTSSMLAPIEPLDGAFLGGWKSLAGSLALIALAVLVAVGAL